FRARLHRSPPTRDLPHQTNSAALTVSASENAVSPDDVARLLCCNRISDGRNPVSGSAVQAMLLAWEAERVSLLDGSCAYRAGHVLSPYWIAKKSSGEGDQSRG